MWPTCVVTATTAAAASGGPAATATGMAATIQAIPPTATTGRIGPGVSTARIIAAIGGRRPLIARRAQAKEAPAGPEPLEYRETTRVLRVDSAKRADRR